VRASSIPYLPCFLQEDAGELFVRSYEAFYLMARASVPLAVGHSLGGLSEEMEVLSSRSCAARALFSEVLSDGVWCGVGRRATRVVVLFRTYVPYLYPGIDSLFGVDLRDLGNPRPWWKCQPV